MKYIIPLFISAFLISFYSCKKVDNTLPPEEEPDSIIVSNGFEYFISATVGGSSMNMNNNVDNVGNGVARKEFAACGFGNETSFTSYFAYVSDTTRKEWLGFGLTNCVSDTADGFTDSTYALGSYPIEISNPGASVGFIQYMDPDSVLWISSASPNGLSAQTSHKFNVTEVIKNYDGFSALQVKGDLSGWVYNPTGDSLLVTVSSFHTRAWAY